MGEPALVGVEGRLAWDGTVLFCSLVSVHNSQLHIRNVQYTDMCLNISYDICSFLMPIKGPAD